MNNPKILSDLRTHIGGQEQPDLVRSRYLPAENHISSCDNSLGNVWKRSLIGLEGRADKASRNYIPTKPVEVPSETFRLVVMIPPNIYTYTSFGADFYMFVYLDVPERMQIQKLR